MTTAMKRTFSHSYCATASTAAASRAYSDMMNNTTTIMGVVFAASILFIIAVLRLSVLSVLIFAVLLAIPAIIIAIIAAVNENTAYRPEVQKQRS
jgi:hypothetical protein